MHAEKAMGETSEDDQQPVETDVILSQEEKEKEEGEVHRREKSNNPNLKGGEKSRKKIWEIPEFS